MRAKIVPDFQKQIAQEFVNVHVSAGCADWMESLSLRLPLDGHPVLSADIMDI